MEKKLPQNMKQAYITANKRYRNAIASSTSDEVLAAMDSNTSVAEALQDEVISLDFSMAYNTGTLPELMAPSYAIAYKQWVKDWGLPAPTGKPPKEMFVYAEHL